MMNGKKIMAIGEFCGDAFGWEFGVPLKDDGTMDGELQRLIEEAEQTRELEDDMADREFWSRGQW